MAIQDNVSIIQTSQGSGSGGWGECNLNIFTQLEEPEIKEGIWIQTNQVYQSITTDPNILNEGGEWGSVMTDIPYEFYYGSAVVYNGEIHILGGEGNGVQTNHYAWNGSSWTRVSTLPYNFYDGFAVVYNGEIHIIGSKGSTNHYAWNGSTWTMVSTLPYYFYSGSAVVYNDEIHILGSFRATGNTNNHYACYAWNGSSWRSVSTLPYIFYHGSSVVYNGEIHILGSYDSSHRTKHYAWNGSSWRSVSTLPYKFYYGSAVVYNGEIHIIGGEQTTDHNNKHYAWNGSSWIGVSTLPFGQSFGSAVVYGKSIYKIGGSDDRRSYCAFTSPDKLFDPHTVIIQKGNTAYGVYQTCFSDTFARITGGNNRFLSGFDDIWYFVETSLDTSSPIYYGNGTKWIKLKN